MMDLIMDNMLTQQITGNTRIREDKPSSLDFVFMRNSHDIKNVKCLYHLGKGDPIVIEIETSSGKVYMWSR